MAPKKAQSKKEPPRKRTPPPSGRQSERDAQGRMANMLSGFLEQNAGQYNLDAGPNPVDSVGMTELYEWEQGVEQAALMQQLAREQEGEEEQEEKDVKTYSDEDAMKDVQPAVAGRDARARKRAAGDGTEQTPVKRARTGVQQATQTTVASAVAPALAANDRVLGWAFGVQNDPPTVESTNVPATSDRTQASQTTARSLIAVLPVSRHGFAKLLQNLNAGTAPPAGVPYAPITGASMPTLAPLAATPALAATTPSRPRLVLRAPSSRPPPPPPPQPNQSAQPIPSAAAPIAPTTSLGRGNRDPAGHQQHLYNWEEEVQILENYTVLNPAVVNTHNTWLATHRPGIVRTLAGMRQHLTAIRGADPARLRSDKKSWAGIQKEDRKRGGGGS